MTNEVEEFVRRGKIQNRESGRGCKVSLRLAQPHRNPQCFDTETATWSQKVSEVCCKKCLYKASQTNSIERDGVSMSC